MRLRALSRYTNRARSLDIWPGQEIEVSEALGQFLLNDAPGTFEDPDAPGDTTEQGGYEGDAPPTGGDPSPTGLTRPIDPMPAVVDALDTDVTVVSDPNAQHQAPRENPEQPELPQDRPPHQAEQGKEPLRASSDAPTEEIIFEPSRSFVDSLEETEEERKAREEAEQKALEGPPSNKAIQRPERKKQP